MDIEKQIDEVRYVGVTNAEVDGAGMTIWWRLSGAIDLAALETAWAAEGLDPKLLPKAPPARRALKRAMKRFSKRRVLVRPLSDVRGYALVSEEAEKSDLDYAIGLRAFVEPAVEKGGEPTLRLEPDVHPLRDRVTAEYLRARGTIGTQDASAWLSRCVEAVDAVPLRDSGGIYFVPRHALPLWRHMVRAVRTATDHKVLGMPAMPADETALALIDAVTAEAERAAVEIEREMEKGVGRRSLEARVRITAEVEQKVSRYELIVGQRLEGVRERLESLRANLSAAIMTAEADEAA